MLYCAIYSGHSIIADYSEDQGDFQITLSKILKVNRQNIDFYVIPYSIYNFFFLHKNDFTFSVISIQNIDQQKIFDYLQNIKEIFFNKCAYEKEYLTIKTTNLIKDSMVVFIFNLE